MRPIAMVAAARLRETPEFNALRMPSRKALPTQLVMAGDMKVGATVGLRRRSRSSFH